MQKAVEKNINLMYYKHIKNRTNKGEWIKIKIIKYIFEIFAIGLIIYAGYTIYKNNNIQQNTVEQSETSQETENIIKDIRIAITNFDTMNPLITTNKEVINISNLIYEPLFTLSKDYSLEPCLATECSKTGNMTYVIKINNQINWQDGTSLISKDIQFTIDTLKAGNSIYKYNVAHIASTEILDASTIKIILDAEIPFFEYNLIFPIMSSNYYYGEDFYTSTKTPIGTGKYKITDISTNSITLARNEKWKPKSQNDNEPKIENIKINLYPTKGEAYNGFKIGNLDLLNTSNPNFEEYIGTIGFNKTEYAGREFDFLSFNCQDEILQDSSVRKAISLAIDKDNIVSTVFNNQKQTAEYPLDYGNFLYNSNEASSGYNIEQAKKTLEDGGWTYINNRWKKNISGKTKTLSLKISVNKNDEERVNVANLIKEQLEEMGIVVTVNQITNEQYSNFIENKNYQILLTGVYTSYSPDLTYYFSNGNLENYYNENMNELMQNASLIKDNNQLKEIYQKIYNQYKQDVPFVGLYRNKNITISSSSLIGDIIVNNYSTLYGISKWYRR